MVTGAEVDGHLLRRLAPQVLGAVARRYGQFDLAEDATQEALAAAALQWPQDGLPENPRSWLVTVASRRLTDLLRSAQARRRREDAAVEWAAGRSWPEPGERRAGESDDTLVLLFMCCHPSRPMGARTSASGTTRTASYRSSSLRFRSAEEPSIGA